MAPDPSASLDRLGFYLMIVGFILGGIAFIVSSTSAYILYRSSSLTQALSNERIATAQATAAQAQEKAAALNLQAQQLKAELAWRRLTQEQASRLIQALKAHKDLQIQVQGLDSDPEASQFHQDIYSTLEAAGLNPSLYTGLERAVGMWVSGANDNNVRTVQEAFQSIGIELHRRPDHGFGAAGEKIIIVVGSKPPVFFSSSNGPAQVNWYDQTRQP